MGWQTVDPDLVAIRSALTSILARPPGDHLGGIAELRRAYPPLAVPEAWNTAFGEGSLFQAWTASPFMRGVYAANAGVIRQAIHGREDWTILEIGGGDGALWREALLPGDRGRIVVVDPADGPHEQVAHSVPEGVEVVAVRAPVEEAELPEADLIVCSLTLHHVPGEDRARCEQWGLPGQGKRAVLERFAAAIGPRAGTVLLNEADVYCDLGLAPGDPVLADRIVDSYVRRCAMGLLHAIDHDGASEALKARWWTIVRRWCIDQLDVVTAPAAERDVYELDVARWLDLLEAAGLQVQAHRFTDRWSLFHQYVATAR